MDTVVQMQRVNITASVSLSMLQIAHEEIQINTAFLLNIFKYTQLSSSVLSVALV
jgi:hypothetical protein